jgi:hypothetical protein
MKNLLIILAFLIISPIMVRAIVGSQTSSPTSEREAFVEGCVGAGATDVTCGCIYDSLSDRYGSDYILGVSSRWENSGFTEEEIQIINACK